MRCPKSPVTLFGIVMLVKLRQSQNALLPIDVTLPGIVTLVSPEQKANASSVIDVTLCGIVMLANLLGQ